jgi:uncharacterized membrane protein
MRRTGVVLVVLSTVLTAVAGGEAAAAPAACAWTPSVLSLPSGALTGEVSATDGAGGYAGTISYGADSPKGGPAVLWKDGQRTDYGFLDEPGYRNWVLVTGVNDAGTVVGYAERDADGLPSAIRSSGGALERLPELPGADASQAEAVNDAGDIVGAVETIEDGAPYWHPVVWPADAPGTVVELTGLPDGEAFVTGIDADGTMLVEVDQDFNRVPYLWKDGTARALTLPEGGYDVITRGIANGRVIGMVSDDSGDTTGVLWDRDGVPRVVPRGDDLRDIDGNGRIVGRTDDADWDEFGVWQLTTLDSTLSYTADRGLDPAVASDDGTIAGRGWAIPGGRDEPTVWRCA